MMSQEDIYIGKCCFCGLECNPSSQSCGACPRAMTSYEFGWASLPEHLKYIYDNGDQEESDESTEKDSEEEQEDSVEEKDT